MPDEPMRVLVISAHPDDTEFSCAGAVARWADEGAEVTYCIVTDGSTGTNDPDLAGEPLAAIRREEAEEAAKVVGVDDIVFLGYRDGYVEPTLELRRDLARVFRRVRPHRLVAMDPSSLPGGWFVNHPDHRAVGQATLDITVTAGTTTGHFPELRTQEGLEPWRDLRGIWIAGPGGGETAVDITSTIDRKIAALECHVSQVGDWDVGAAVRGWTRENGKAHGFEYAETFKVIRPLGAQEEDAAASGGQ